MAIRRGKTIITDIKPKILSFASVVGKKEGEGPLGKEFDEIYEDTTMGEDSWEKAESLYLKTAIKQAIAKSNLQKSDIDIICSGDLLNQCIGSSFGIRDFGLPLHQWHCPSPSGSPFGTAAEDPRLYHAAAQREQKARKHHPWRGNQGSLRPRVY